MRLYRGQRSPASARAGANGSAVNYYQRHVGDITRDTFGLAPAEFGCYDRMLDYYYQTEKPLPLDVSPTIQRTVSPAENETSSSPGCSDTTVTRPGLV